MAVPSGSGSGCSLSALIQFTPLPSGAWGWDIVSGPVCSPLPDCAGGATGCGTVQVHTVRLPAGTYTVGTPFQVDASTLTTCCTSGSGSGSGSGGTGPVCGGVQTAGTYTVSFTDRPPVVVTYFPGTSLWDGTNGPGEEVQLACVSAPGEPALGFTNGPHGNFSTVSYLGTVAGCGTWAVTYSDGFAETVAVCPGAASASPTLLATVQPVWVPGPVGQPYCLDVAALACCLLPPPGCDFFPPSDTLTLTCVCPAVPQIDGLSVTLHSTPPPAGYSNYFVGAGTVPDGGGGIGYEADLGCAERLLDGNGDSDFTWFLSLRFFTGGGPDSKGVVTNFWCTAQPGNLPGTWQPLPPDACLCPSAWPAVCFVGPPAATGCLLLPDTCYYWCTGCLTSPVRALAFEGVLNGPPPGAATPDPFDPAHPYHADPFWTGCPALAVYVTQP